MSVWKKVTKTRQKTHRERHQPEERKHLGLLEKKKDYVRRARDFNEKKETLKVLRKRALNKNPDEFYHHMINSKVEEGRHFEKETEDEDSPEQVRLMRTQDLKYIVTKRTQETKKIEKLQSQLHLLSVDHQNVNKHLRFDGSGDRQEAENSMPKLEVSKLNIEDLLQAAKKKKQMYIELSKRIVREQELAVVQQKIELKKNLENKTTLPPKRVRKGNKSKAAVFMWKYERKK